MDKAETTYEGYAVTNSNITGHEMSLSEKYIKVFVKRTSVDTERARNDIVLFYKERFPLTFIEQDVDDESLAYSKTEGFYYLYKIKPKAELNFVRNVKRLEFISGKEREKTIEEIVEYIGFKT